ncbi:histidine phosphatase family protein [Microbacterium sp. NPDC076895]|uniref:histidine phosphatase family protein n=1 Tax=unclassified Microbacterium TaxID=2609290 RepID=UPI00342F9395
MIHLTLIRHGETDWNRARLIQGSTDIPLNDTGREQARQTADRLSGVLDDPAAARIVSSDLSRARETAQIIADQWGSPAPLAYPALRERAYGDAEGVTIEDFAARWGDWYTSEVPGAESRELLRLRAFEGFDTLVTDALRSQPDVTHIFVVTHGALIRSVIHHVSDGRLPARQERLANGSDYTFHYSPDGLTLIEYAGTTVSL